MNQALFSLLGTTYGGDGRTTFALPDLRGHLALGFGQGHGLPLYNLGQVGAIGDGGTELRSNNFLALNFIIALEGIYPARQ